MEFCQEHGKYREDVHTIKNSLQNIQSSIYLMKEDMELMNSKLDNLSYINYKNGGGRHVRMGRDDFSQMGYNIMKDYEDTKEIWCEKFEVFDEMNKSVKELVKEKEMRAWGWSKMSGVWKALIILGSGFVAISTVISNLKIILGG